MQLKQKFTQQCPCCNEKIIFKGMFKAWSSASKNDDKLVRCPKCHKPIQKLALYEKYGLSGALPLFAIPLVFESQYIAYLVGLFSLLYGIFLFWMLYILVPLECIDENNQKDVIERASDQEEKYTQYAIIIITLVFFLSIFSMFYSFNREMKNRKKAQEHNSTRIEHKMSNNNHNFTTK